MTNSSDQQSEARAPLMGGADRLRFDAFTLERLPSGNCRARVELSWQGTQRWSGHADGLSTAAGELRCSAMACVEALHRATDSSIAFELLGVKAVRAFDATVVIVSLAAPGQASGQRMVGSCLSDEDVNRGAALAVLNATNRLLGNRFHMR